MTPRTVLVELVGARERLNDEDIGGVTIKMMSKTQGRAARDESVARSRRESGPP